MIIFALILFALLCFTIYDQQKKVAKLEQENAFLRKKLHWKGVFNTDLEDE